MARTPRVLYPQLYTAEPYESDAYGDRQTALARKTEQEQDERKFDRIAKINQRPGFQTIAGMKFNKGG